MLPAYAGMILDQLDDIYHAARAPRVCGDDPYSEGEKLPRWKCSPRMRG